MAVMRRTASIRESATAIRSPWAGRPDRARQRELKRDAVILVAARAFKARGFHNTSVDDIAAMLQVTKPTIYHYLANKEEILFECFRSGLDQILEGFSQLQPQRQSGREQLLAVMARYAEAITSDFGWCMVRAEDQDLSLEMSRRIQALKRQIDAGLRRLIQAGIADGSIRDCDPKMTAFALAGALNWISHWHREGAALAPKEIAARFTEVFDLGLRPRNK